MVVKGHRLDQNLKGIQCINASLLLPAEYCSEYSFGAFCNFIFINKIYFEYKRPNFMDLILICLLLNRLCSRQPLYVRMQFWLSCTFPYT
jgi:hypothetical protein